MLNTCTLLCIYGVIHSVSFQWHITVHCKIIKLHIITHYHNHDNLSILPGDLIIIIAQITAATQMVYEEKYVTRLDVHPLQAVGLEGTVLDNIFTALTLTNTYWCLTLCSPKCVPGQFCCCQHIMCCVFFTLLYIDHMSKCVTEEQRPVNFLSFFAGFFGFFVLGLLLIPMYYIPAGAPFTTNPDGRLENALDAFYMLRHSWQIMLATIGGRMTTNIPVKACDLQVTFGCILLHLLPLFL